MLIDLRSCIWLLAFGGSMACGATARSPGADVETNGGAAAGQAGRPSVAGGGNGAGGLQLGGTLSQVESESGGELNLGGVGDPGVYDGPVGLCLYDEDIPEEWGAGGGPGGANTPGGSKCAVGVLGEFVFEQCRYELLSPMAYDVDPFVGGHSHCCYASKLIGCR